MKKADRLSQATSKKDDDNFDLTLRPGRLLDYIGQENTKANLKIFMTAAKKRKEPIEHVLLHGGPGLGKTTLAYIIAKEMGVNIRITSGPAIERTGDLAAILTNLQQGDILFIDEIHRLNKIIEEVLYPAMEDYALDLVIGKGPAARTLRIDLPRFTLIGATTKMNLISSPLRDRFNAQYKLNLYELQEIERIVNRSAQILNIDLENQAALEIAKRSRATPRIANRFLKRVRDYAQVNDQSVITMEVAKEALNMLEIDSLGLDNIDRKILQTIIDKFNGGPVGLQTIAASCSEDMETLEDIYEPFLMQLGFLARTPRGRVVTEHGYRHLGKKVPPHHQGKLI